MKKTYLAPAVMITGVEMQMPIAYSITNIGGDSGIGMGTGETPTEAGSRRRRRNDWEDEWEDEEEEW